MRPFKKQEPSNAVQLKLMRIIKTLDSLCAGGQLHIDEDESRVVISCTLAQMYIGSQDKFSNFLNHVSVWMSYNRSLKVMKGYTREQLNSMEKPPIPPNKQIEFCIVNPKGEPVVVGNYLDNHLNMVPYKDIKNEISE